jgi:hypothetical protein
VGEGAGGRDGRGEAAGAAELDAEGADVM